MCLPKINGRHVSTKPVLKGIEAAKEAGLEVKVNMVVTKGMNDSQILPMAQYFKEQEIQLRFIEFMDVGSTNGWNFEQVVTKEQLIEKINRVYPIEPVKPRYFGEVAKLYRYVGSDAEVGFITSVSEPFCSSCTRARISADGKFLRVYLERKEQTYERFLEKIFRMLHYYKFSNIHGSLEQIDIQMKERRKAQINVKKLKCLTLADSERRFSYARAIFKTSIVFWNR